MKNADIHKGFERAEVRDFLSKSIVGNGYIGEVARLQNHILELKAQLEIAKTHAAVCELIAAQGWHQFDVSSEIADYKPREYFSFVGTKEEHEELIKKMENENF